VAIPKKAEEPSTAVALTKRERRNRNRSLAIKEARSIVGVTSEIPHKEISQWDRKFLEMPQQTLYNVILAALYLDMNPLIELTCLHIAQMIKGKSTEEIRELLNIKNDFTPEEEEKIRQENKQIAAQQRLMLKQARRKRK